MYMYVNDKLVKEEEAIISPFDHGYMYGLGLFETFRLYEGHPFLLDDHFVRLEEGLRALAIDWTYNRSHVLHQLATLCNKNGVRNAYIRWNVSAGPGPIGLYTDTYKEPTVIIYMKSLPQGLSTRKTGTLLELRRNTPEGDRRLKSHHFLNNVLGKREVAKDPQTEGIFLTEDGVLAEGLTSNVFWVKNGVVYTPSVDTGILNGITRQFVLTLCDKEGIPWREGRYPKEALLKADGAFITNSIQEIVTLTSVGQAEFNQDEAVIMSLRKSYQKYCTKLWSKNEIKEGKQDVNNTCK
ncbi:aminodeoxychorismate lyase [Halalkalibacterium halodurans]|uniref:4-amino-4-deoxychorismate lyase n=1 Tax=Halalkalibacterium halodurans (strain ATCC BAA-125 / DSM 18197 / FERM 7344 / JCM 9153 / C-125) TaxID=272558 RepID=Q9KGH0_HALH5|nr:aminodeoxychorismate lyase [Halalkalibacterium halodurans]MED4123776.1 aminodeoxychorismate lyase [Halalkalibacterium halodurans]MED4174787.1 aminodeoxychorismate lyase [Halalkalibacterium halodurans]BAB03811.1 4-amino-4-deoxychorismate lyase [Halalkalibacterium halodurans C-125]